MSSLPAEIEAILATSVPNNAKLDISGDLVAHGGWFLRVLEGAEYQLYELFKEICLDPRHIDVEVMGEGPVRARESGDWSMCAAELSKADVKIVGKLDLKPDFDPSKCSVKLLLSLLETIVGVQKVTGQFATRASSSRA
ncbi:BLUF domain-containing protein [Phenylobacterium sp.]|uniref:BLUF domain-containing protein n=1 Tax=Phenylobacterium sp. TaxID=1871053 RepID=UPI0037CBCDC5